MDKLLTVNEKMRRKTSETGTSVAFIPGSNFVYELNESASVILEKLDIPMTMRQLLQALMAEYEIEDPDEFQLEVKQVVDRFLKHEILIAG